MAKAFNLTAQINLQGPTNLKPVVSNLKKQLSGITANVKLNIDPKASKNVNNITQQLQAMNAVLIQAQTNTNNLNNSLAALGSSLGAVGNKGTSTATSISKTGASAQSAAKAIKQAGTEMQEFGKQSALAIRRLAAFSVVSTAVYGLVNAINSGFKAFISFDKELIKLQQVTGQGAAGIASLEKEITRLATTLGVSSESLTSVASTLAQAGLSAEETRVALAALAKTELAPSFDNLTDTTEGAIAAIRQFGLEASELEPVLGSINAVAAAFAVESKDIISAIQRTGGVFAAASKGVSQGSDALNEFVAIFTSVRQTTRESAETIATGLRTIFTRIQRGSTIEQLREFGVELTDLEGKFVGPYEAVKRLSSVLGELDPRDLRFSQIVEELGGFRQIGKVIPLIQQFSVAQEALKVAQRGQGSLAEAQAVAQKSLANQIAKVREQFLALIRDIGKSSVFKGLFTLVINLTSGLISLASAFKPILPILSILGAIKGVSAIGQFATGFFGGLKKGGGSSGAGQNIGGAISGANAKQQQNALNQASTAISKNTSAIQTLTTAINNLSKNVNDNTITLNTRTAKGLNKGGKVLAFARGGVVPGKGDRDTVPAMLQPGEFVIRKKAVETIGSKNLQKMNKYAKGGSVKIGSVNGNKKAKDGDTFYADVTPQAEKFRAEFRISEWDAYETKGDSKITNKKWEEISKYNKNNKIQPSFRSKNTLTIPPDTKVTPSLTAVEAANQATTALQSKLTKAGNKGVFDTIEQGKLDLYNRFLASGSNALDIDNQFKTGRTFRLAKGGKVQKFSKGGITSSRKGISLGARSKFKELNEEELAELNTYDLIAYGKALAYDIFTSGGAGMAIGNEFIEVPQERIIPELEPYLVSYLGKKGFWKEKIAPFGKQIQSKVTKTANVSREASLEAQVAKQADEVAARSQQWTSIRNNSDIDKYLLSSLAEPILSDYKSAKEGRSLAKPFHNTRLRQAVNSSLENYDDFDYSASNIDKLVSGMAAKTFSHGGLIQKFMAGTEVQPISGVGRISQDILDRIKSVGGAGYIKGAVTVGEINRLIKEKLPGKSITAGQLLKTNVLRGMTDSASLLPVIEPVLMAAEKKKQEEEQAKFARAGLQTQAGEANKFALASIFPLGENRLTDVKEIEGKDGKKFLTQLVLKGLPSQYSDIVEKYREKLQGIPTSMAEDIQYRNIFGPGSPLAFDFDETLVKGADIYNDKGQIDFTGYNDPSKVQKALANAELTLLGKELKKRLSEYPQLLENIRVLTARPQNNVPYLAAKLNELGLRIPESKVTGVSGGLNKVKNLSDIETLIDDNLQNLESVTAGGKKAIGYREPQGYRSDLASSVRSQQVIEGYIAEELLRDLGAPLKSEESDPLRPIDYPRGLGTAAGIWGLPSGIPTDVKRSINGSSIGRLWKETQRFYVEKFADGGMAEPSKLSFEDVKKKIMDQYPEINFRITKRKKGFGYNILGGLKQEGNNIGNYADFQQATNLIQLQELAEKMSSSLLYEYGPDIDRSLLKKKQKLADGGPIKDIWHGTTTGQNDKVLEDFKTVGAKADVSSGFGQGKGFYVYGGQTPAMLRALSLEGGSSEFLNAADPSGRPMALKFTEQLNSKNWDLDYEFQNEDVVSFIHQNFDRVKKALENAKGLSLENQLSEFSLDTKYDEYLDVNDNKPMRKVGISFKEENKKVERLLANVSGDVRSAQVLSGLTSSLLATDPDFYNEFEQSFFSNLQPEQAIKYVGSQPLKPVLAEIFNRQKNINDTGWTIEKFAKGGAAEDTVPALLTPGEFVINKKAAKKIGYTKLHQLNKADKIQGYNKGGVVDGVQRFVVGGVAEKQTARGQGAVLMDVKHAEKTMAIILGNLGKQIRDNIVKPFKGIEQVAAGRKTSLGTSFSEGTRGQAVFGTKNNKAVSVMGLQIGGKHVQATTETVSHETGHLADVAMAGNKGFASNQQGTFQFDLVEKIKPVMERAYIKAGEKSKRIYGYLLKNEELFAEFFAKASPEVQAIITSTTDSKKGMEKLRDHLEKAGHTFAGLEASDLVPPGSGGTTSMPPIPPAPPPTVPPTPPTVPPSGPPSGSPPVPPSMPPIPPSPAGIGYGAASEDDKEFFAYKAKKAGKTLGQYKSDATRQVAVAQKEIIENQKGRREETRREFQGQATATGKNLKSLRTQSKSSKSATDIQKFNDAYKQAVEEAASKLKEIAPSLSPKELARASQELVKAMMDGKSVNDAIAEKGSALEKAFTADIKSSDALKLAIEQTAEKLEISADQLKGNLSRADIRRQQFIQSETGQKFGRAAEFAPDMLRKFSKTSTGQATLKAADVFSGKGLTAGLEKRLGAAGTFIGEKIESLGGPMVVLGSTMAIAADQISKAFDGIQDPRTAGIIGGIGGAGSGLASGAVLGGQIAGPVGAMIGGITGAIVGGIDGAFKAFNQARLAKNLKELEDSSHKASLALKEFETNQTNETANALIEASMGGQGAIKDLSQQAQIQYGEKTTGRAIVDALSQLPVIGSIMGTAERPEAVQALDKRAEMVIGNFERVGQRQLNRAPIAQVQAVIDRANEAERAAGGADTDTGRQARRDVYAQANQTYQQMARQGYSDTDIYTGMGRQALRQEGKSAEEISKMSQEDVIKAGKEAAAVSAQAAFKQQQLSDAIRETNKSVENLLDIFRLASAGLDRFNYELSQIGVQAEEQAAILSGRATIGNVDRGDEQVLNNISGYSRQEVQAVASRVGSIAGGDGGSKLESQIVAAKVLKDELPNILRNTSGQDAGAVTEQLRKVFKDLKIEAPEGLFNAVEANINEKIGDREGVPLSEIADEIDIVGIASKVAGEALALGAKYLQSFNNAMQQAAELTNKYGEALNQATEWQLKAADIRARADIQLAETLGKNLSIDQQAAPFENRIRGLTGGVVAGGSVDPNEIYQAMIDAGKTRESMQAELAQRQTTLAKNPEDEGAKKAVIEQEKLLAKQNNSINNANKALEELAGDSSRAAAALQKLSELNKIAGASVDFLRKALTSDSKDLIKMNKQMQDYTKLISGQANVGDVNNLEFRQNAFAGLDMVSSMMPESLGKQLEAKMTRAMLEATPGGQQLLQQTTGAIGPDGQKLTFDQTLAMMEGGVDPAQQQYIDAYKAATERQAQAADRLGDAAVAVADVFANKLTETIDKLSTITKPMQTAEEATKTPEKTPEEAKDNTVQLVMSQEEIDKARAGLFGDLPTLGFDAATAGTLDTTMRDLINGIAALTTAVIALTAAFAVYKGIQSAGSIGQAVSAAGDFLGGRRRRRGFGGSAAPAAGSKAAKSASSKARYKPDGVQGEAARAPKTKEEIAAQRKRIEAKQRKADEATTKPRSSADVVADTKTKATADVVETKTKTPKASVPDVNTKPVARAAGAVVDSLSSLDEVVTVAQSVSNIATGQGTVEDVIYGAQSAAEIVANNPALVSKVPGVGQAAQAVSGATGGASGFVALNTAISALTNLVSVISDPKGYSERMQNKSDAGLASAQNRTSLGFVTDSLLGGLEGFSDPIGKIVEAGYVLKDLGSDVYNASEAAAKSQRMESSATKSRLESRGEKGAALASLPFVEQNRAIEEANTKIELNKAKEIQAKGGSLEDFSKLFDINADTLGVSNIEELIAKTEAKLKDLPSQRQSARNKDVTSSGNTADPVGFAEAVKQEMAFKQVELGKKEDETAATQAELAKTQAITNSTGALETFATNLVQLNNILSGLLKDKGLTPTEDTVANAEPQLDAMEQMAKDATTKGSIYTHDVHLEGLLKNLLGSNNNLDTVNTEISLADPIKNMTSLITENIGKLPFDISSIKDLITPSLGSIGDIKNIKIPEISDFIPSGNIIDSIKNLIPQGLMDQGTFALDIFKKALIPAEAEATIESCECKILQDILNVLKGQKTTTVASASTVFPASVVASAEKIVASKSIGAGTLDGGVIGDQETLGLKTTTPAVISAPPAPGIQQAIVKSQAEATAVKPVNTKRLAYEQAKKQRRASYLAKFRPEVRERMMTKEEKAAQVKKQTETRIKEKQATEPTINSAQPKSDAYDKLTPAQKQSLRDMGESDRKYTSELEQKEKDGTLTHQEENYLRQHREAKRIETGLKQKYGSTDPRMPQNPNNLTRFNDQPVPSTLPNIRGGSLDGGASADAGIMGGPTGQLATIITVDKSATDLLDGLKSTFSNFNSYIDKLATIAATIPSEISLVGNYDLNINITGAAAFEGLSKEMQGIAEAIIRPKLEQLRDEVSQATKGAVKNSASIGYRGDVNTSTGQGQV